MLYAQTGQKQSKTVCNIILRGLDYGAENGVKYAYGRKEEKTSRQYFDCYRAGACNRSLSYRYHEREERYEGRKRFGSDGFRDSCGIG